MKTSLIVCLAAIIIVAGIFGGAMIFGIQIIQFPQDSDAVQGQEIELDTEVIDTIEPTPEPEPEPEPLPDPVYVTFGAVGDNLFHNTVIDDGNYGNGNYDYSHMYEDIKPLVESVDFAFINQESPVSDTHAPSGYPTFNTPQAIAQNLSDAGFDIINQANNHSMDKGSSAVLSTVELWNTFDNITMIGMYDSQEDRDELEIVEKDGVSVGFLTYTYGTNGIPVPSDSSYMIPLIDDAVITEDVTAARDKCDALVVSMHWGSEYHLQNSDEQTRLANLLNSLGVDVIIGHHPHVIQPIEIITGEDGHETLVFYSLGNFISAQNKPDRMLGLFAGFTIMKDSYGEISVIDGYGLPVVTHFVGFADYTVLPINMYTSEYASTHSIRSYGNVSPEYYDSVATEVLGEFYVREPLVSRNTKTADDTTSDTADDTASDTTNETADNSVDSVE